MLSDATIRRLCAELGNRVKAARERAKLSPKQLGGVVGLSRSSIANLEAGRQRIPIHIVWSLADALKVSVADLLPNPESTDTASKPKVKRLLKEATQLEKVSPASKAQLTKFIESRMAQIAASPPQTKEG